MRVRVGPRQRDGDQRTPFRSARSVRRRSRLAVRGRDAAAPRRRRALPVRGRSPVAAALLWRYGAPCRPRCSLAIGSACGAAASRFGPLAGAAVRPRALAWRSRSAAPASSPCVTATASRCTRRRARSTKRPRAHSRLRRLPADRAARWRGSPASIDALASAIHHAGLRTPHELRSTMALLETLAGKLRARIDIEGEATAWNT